MKTRFLSIMAMMMLALSSAAQTATDILDRTASTLKGSGGIEAQFEATTFQGTTEKGQTNGTICVKGDKFKVVTPDGNIWFDGKTQWSLYANSDEVNVSNPTEKEIQSINPYTFINLYKHGFNHTMTTTTYKGAACYNVRMTPQKPSHIKEMRVIVDKKTYLPYSIRIKQDNDWFRVRISSIKTKNKWKDNFFRFNEKEYPNIEVIDLR